jgi:hypothetical protein
VGPDLLLEQGFEYGIARPCCLTKSRAALTGHGHMLDHL